MDCWARALRPGLVWRWRLRLAEPHPDHLSGEAAGWEVCVVKKQTNNAPQTEPEILGPEPSRKPTGRPSSYTFEVSEEICHQMAGGKGLRQICAQEGMPSRPTVLRWLQDNAGFRARYARAREALMDWYGEEIM